MPGMPLRACFHFVGLVVDALQIGTKDPDDKRFLGAGKHLVDGFVEIRFDIVEHSGIAGNDFFNRVECFVVVHVRIDADPIFAEVDAVRFVCQAGLARYGSQSCERREFARSSLLARMAMRRSSATEVPGLVIQCMRKSRSLNSGNSDSPNNGNNPKPRIMTRRGCKKHRAGPANDPRQARVHKCGASQRTSGGSRCSIFALRKRM